MRLVRMVALLLLLIAATADAQVAPAEKVCRAERRGETLITTVVYADGYKVEGPWRITDAKLSGSALKRITAILDLVIETDSYTQQRQLMPLPGAIQLTFEGRTHADVIQEAARIWCRTVAKARAGQVQPHGLNGTAPARVVM